MTEPDGTTTFVHVHVWARWAYDGTRHCLVKSCTATQTFADLGGPR